MKTAIRKVTLSAAALILSVSATFTLAAQDAETEQQQFCQAMHKAAWSIMYRLNTGVPVQTIYADIGRDSDVVVNGYLNQVATIANVFPRDADPDKFAVWQYEVCMGTAK